MNNANHLQENVTRFDALAEVYDTYRPQPPGELASVLARYACVERPALVVDLGSATGLSTRFWQTRADRVIGIEPNDDMRAKAVLQTEASNVSYVRGYSHATGLDDGCADIVTCAQSLHWMAPEPTFLEIARLLRTGGVFAAYDNDWPPTMNAEAENAFLQFRATAERIGRTRNLFSGVIKWNKDEHLERMRESGFFRYAREFVLHHVESGDAERLVGLALSQGDVSTVLRSGITEAELGVDDFRARARQAFGDKSGAWYFGYRVRIGTK
jgi:SAM-dependent methyltransferase